MAYHTVSIWRHTAQHWNELLMQYWNGRFITLEDSELHYDDVIMTMLASQITSLTVVYSIVYSGVFQRKHQSSASLAFVQEIHRGPVNFPHKWPVTRKMFPFDDVIMFTELVTKYFLTWVLVVWQPYPNAVDLMCECRVYKTAPLMIFDRAMSLKRKSKTTCIDRNKLLLSRIIWAVNTEHTRGPFY